MTTANGMNGITKNARNGIASAMDGSAIHAMSVERNKHDGLYPWMYSRWDADRAGGVRGLCDYHDSALPLK